MNAPFPQSALLDQMLGEPRWHADRDKAFEIASALIRYANALPRNDHMALLDAYNGWIDFVDDGDALIARRDLCDEMGWDTEGYPVDENGDRIGEPRGSRNRRLEMERLLP